MLLFDLISKPQSHSVTLSRVYTIFAVEDVSLGLIL